MVSFSHHITGYTENVVKHYTFRIACSFTMQFTFPEQGVEQDADGNDGDVMPTDEALERLRLELQEYFGEYAPVADVEAFADSDSLLGVVDDTPA